MNNLIDFHGATHGHFLEYIVNTWIYQGPRVNNVFTELGTCHLPGKNPQYLADRQIFCGHFTELGVSSNVVPSKLIRIVVDTDRGKVIHMINNMYRVGDITLLGSYQNIPLEVRDSSVRLRNDWYSKLVHSENQYRLDYEWRWPNVDSFEFPMENLYDLSMLYQTMYNCASYLEQRFVPDQELYKIWQQFMDLNQGVQTFDKCKRLVESALAQNKVEFDSIEPEQALINAMLGYTVGIFDGPLFSHDQYPTNTTELWNHVMAQLTVFDQKF